VRHSLRLLRAKIKHACPAVQWLNHVGLTRWPVWQCQRHSVIGLAKRVYGFWLLSDTQCGVRRLFGRAHGADWAPNFHCKKSHLPATVYFSKM